ncbi:MAG: hypothetical protein ACREB3_02575 [Burkholderiales bacterium]
MSAMLRGGILALLLLAGCGGHSSVQLGSGGAPASSGGGSVSVNSQPRSALGNLVVFGTLVGVYHGSDSAYGSRYRSNPFMAIQPTMPAPELDSARTVHEQDCSRPIENWSANLKCR